MLEVFGKYLKALQSTPLDQKTEHMDRPALQALLQAIAYTQQAKPQVIHEPKRNSQGLGAPDYIIKSHGSIIGYVENKQIGENLDKIIKSSQIKKYTELSNNLLITNYLEWVWLRDGVVTRETLCYSTDLESPKFKLNPDKIAAVQQLIQQFLSVVPKGIGKAKILAEELSARSRWLRDLLHGELTRQEKEHKEGKLFGLFQTFKTNVFPLLTLAEFADAFAQMLSYGLFLAKLNAGNNKVTLENTDEYIPATFELIKELVDFLSELNRPEYVGIRWIVEEILGIMNQLDLPAIHEDLAFSKKQGKLFDATEEERLLFAKDPYVYFYEDFLAKYDAKMRKAKGVYYTPPPVVNFIVRAIDQKLKEAFGISQGLADRNKVTVLDFATGTGTFLLEIIQQILQNTTDAKKPLVIQEHVLKNLYGFEYLIAPYTVAHLKLSQFLKDNNYPLKQGERLQVYLTNTLEPIHAQANLLLPALSREGQAAQAVKDKGVLVVTGNPPYNVKSRNTGEWITRLLRGADTSDPHNIQKVTSYFENESDKLKERNPKNLLDDYVKFIRFAQWNVEKHGQGIVGIITNHSFINNSTFRLMRKSLMDTFDQIYIIDLHGNSKKKEKAPDGSKDENVFDIEQGVAISIFVKKPGLPRKVCRGDFWGKRKDKYRACVDSEFNDMEWQEVQPAAPYYLFAHQDKGLRAEYDKGISVADIFKVQSTGVKTHRDHFVIDRDEATLRKRIEDFRNLQLSDAEIGRKYALESNRDWNLAEKRKALAADTDYANAFTHMMYRPFDIQHYFHHDDAVDWTRNEVMKHFVGKDNIGLGTTRGKEIGAGWEHALIAGCMIQHHTVSMKEVNYYFPLYLYNFPENKKPKASLFENDEFEGKERIENFNPNFREISKGNYQSFRQWLDNKYQHHYSPEDVLGYMYAILHSPTYREIYREFLEIDFPRIPFVDDRETFEQLSQSGWQLVQAHLMKPDSSALTQPEYKALGEYAGKGDNRTVENLAYQSDEQKLYINPDRFFAHVPPEVWEFHIGGYPVLEKYLKSRKGRELTLDEIENVEKIVKILRFTMDQMEQINGLWQP